MGESTTVRVEGRLLRLTNLDKVLYPEQGFTKAEVIDYYSRVAPVLLPRLVGRPVTLRRYPDGVEGPSFFEKNVPGHAPEWVRTVRIETPGSAKGNEFADFVVVEDLATLVWVANLAALELHVPQWTVGPRGGRRSPDLLVFDLDPGLPATVVECCRVAELLRVELERDGLVVFAKTSGSKGMQLCAAVEVSSPERTAVYAKGLAQRLAAEHPELVVSTMARAARPGKVLIDWSQNNPAKTTVVAYSLRARVVPSVSTPVSWDEVKACARPEDLVFTAEDVLGRVTHGGDLFAELLDDPVRLPG
ncbi:non-homologous end-joining DNA ligase [Umezawaea endophytica]|uniref:Non-homologous end-joining DNA ligase n=1 Tax=Umezawaea endophytica TaxID=1654476 RepID=A0A9X2VQI5_9PSEU|nr:non-homologous end-joining DNA ligase [Umezawaea endophytica]MCS7479618.1 non-homologous end-joining DNA ligase [Umezawaea endophytica]